MNDGIELHDSELSGVVFLDDSAVLSFEPAYRHYAGSGWSQSAKLSFSDVSSATISLAKLPVGVSDGLLRIGDTMHDNLIPAEGTFEGAIEFSLVLVTAETLNVRAQCVSIQLFGEPSYIEALPDFTRKQHDGHR